MALPSPSGGLCGLPSPGGAVAGLELGPPPRLSARSLVGRCQRGGAAGGWGGERDGCLCPGASHLSKASGSVRPPEGETASGPASGVSALWAGPPPRGTGDRPGLLSGRLWGPARASQVHRDRSQGGLPALTSFEWRFLVVRFQVPTERGTGADGRETHGNTCLLGSRLACVCVRVRVSVCMCVCACSMLCRGAVAVSPVPTVEVTPHQALPWAAPGAALLSLLPAVPRQTPPH